MGHNTSCIRKRSRHRDRYKRLFQNLSIRNKLFVILFLIVFISLAISLSIMDITFNIYNELLYRQAAQVLNLSSASIEEYLKRVEKLSYNIATSEGIQKCAYMIKYTKSDYEKNNYIKELSNQLIKYSLTENNLPSISFFDGHKDQLNRGSSPKDYTDKDVNDIIHQALSAEGRDVIIPSVDDKNTVLIARMIRRVDALSLEYIGTIVIKCDLDGEIGSYLLEVENNHPELAVLHNKGFIYKSQSLYENELRNLFYKEASGYDIRVLNGKKYFIAHNISDYTGWIYISTTPYESIFRKVIIMRTIVFLYFFLLFVLSLFIGVKLAMSFTKPLEQLTRKMKQVENGYFNIEWNEAENYELQDEISQLNKDFRIMINKIDTLISEDYVKQLLIKDTQLMALQAQINPHFLYNTLESINWLAKLNQQRDISKMAEALGVLMRGAISSKERLVPLREEIKFLESYITIQKIRYEDRLDFIIDMDESLEEYKVPKLILQPLVENAIHYGLEKMLSACVIEVKILLITDYFIISVQDNGPGIEPETLSKIKNWDIQPNGLGIGLKNIHERIRLVFGEKYGIEVFSETGTGTRVQIRIPYDAEGQNV